MSFKPDIGGAFVGVLCLGLALTIACSSNKANLAPAPPGVTVAPVVQKDVPIHQEWVGTMVTGPMLFLQVDSLSFHLVQIWPVTST